MGMGFKERQGAGNSIAVHVPGMQIEAFPKLTHGRILNSVFRSVGHTGTSKGMGIVPTDSGGMGRSGGHGRAAGPPATLTEVMRKGARTIKTNTGKRRELISIPRNGPLG